MQEERELLGNTERDLLRTDEVEEVIANCFLSTKTTAKVLFPERITRPFTSIHDILFQLLDDDSKQKVAIAAPRGFGKTTLNTIVYPAKKILFNEKHFIMPVSATASSALTQGENLKRELLTNLDIIRLFGPMKSEVFSKDQWVTANNIMILPRGAGQQVRGQLFHRYRPDLIIVDDLETTEGVQSDEQRKKLKEWFYSDLCNCVDRSSKDWKIVYIGTVLHEDALLTELLEDPTWASIRLEICDDEFKSNWPDFMSSEECKQLYEEYKRKGQSDVFFREYRNLPISTEDATFKGDLFKYYDENDESFKPKDLLNAVIVDPAKTTNLHSAESAIVGWGVDRSGHKLYVRDVVSGKFRPDHLYDEIFNMVKVLNAQILAIEVTSLNEFIVQPIKNEMRVRGIFPRFVELKARDKKDTRVAALAPFYRLGYIYHNPRCCDKLESQLLMFPRSKYWDVMDAAAYIVELLELEGDYFDPGSYMDSPDSEYDELDNEDPVKFIPYV